MLLSALLLTRLLVEEQRRTGAVAIGRFYMRRGLRIWPLYAVFVAGVGLWAALRGAWTTEHTLRAFGLATFTDNLFTAFDGYNPFPVAGHLWTLSLEEQFYLLLPWVAGARRRIMGGIVVIACVFITARIVCVASGAPHPAIWVSLFSGDALLLGTALGAVGAAPGRLNDVALLMVGVALLMGAPLWAPPIDAPGAHAVWLYAAIALGAGALCVAAMRAPWLRWLGARPLRDLGRISYGLYVFHLLGIHAARRLVPATGPAAAWCATAALALAITVGAAALSYAVLERPFLRLKARFEVVPSRAA